MVSLSALARSSFLTRSTRTKTGACTTGIHSVNQQLGFLFAVHAVAQQERSRPTTCPACTHTRMLFGLSLARLAQLDASRASAAGGNGTSDSCELCPPGASSPAGATACAECLLGMFNEYDILECASCQPGFFGDGVGLTMCQECAVGSCTSTEQQTACDECLAGSFLVARDAGCQQCSPGTFRSMSMSMNACSPCDAGRFQQKSSQSGCHQCSAVLDPEGPNLHLWTTMRSIENAEWMEISGSHSLSDCGCAVGAWLDAFGQCQECGVGIVCKGMGVVEVLPGYFARADSPGFVWRCHGADWARCPGGRPGTCAHHRLNTSTACEECEPYTRSTNDGPCKARSVVPVFSHLESVFSLFP